MDRFNWGLLACVVAVLFVLPSFMVNSEHAAYKEACAKSGGVPLITKDTLVCIDKASTLSIIPVTVQ